jgi:thiol:disulfide interchange protein
MGPMRPLESRRSDRFVHAVPLRATVRRAAARLGAVLLLLAACGGTAASESSPRFDPTGWLSGADGLYGALASIKKQGSPPPMVVYFYTDWCGYCRQFERELLSTAAVKRYFQDVLAVRINPEKGPRERQIADYYGVSGYPAFFVHSNRSHTLSRVERMRVVEGRPRMLSPDEFIAAVRDAGER